MSSSDASRHQQQTMTPHQPRNSSSDAHSAATTRARCPLSSHPMQGPPAWTTNSSALASYRLDRHTHTRGQTISKQQPLSSLLSNRQRFRPASATAPRQAAVLPTTASLPTTGRCNRIAPARQCRLSPGPWQPHGAQLHSRHRCQPSLLSNCCLDQSAAFISMVGKVCCDFDHNCFVTQITP